MTIAITGASGQLGRLVVEKLKNRVAAAEIVALARNPQKVADLGVAARTADYAKPETLAAALAGIDTLLLISSSEVGQRTPQHRNVIDAAKKARVKRIVYTSLLRADKTPMSLGVEHRETEAILRESGIPFTILRNGWYMENHTGSAKAALAAGALIGAAGDGRFAAAAREDYAEAAAVVLTTPGHEGKTYELAGDAPYTLAQAAAEIGRHAGKDLPYRDLGQAGYAAALEGVGLPAALAQAIAGWDVDASNGALDDDSHALSALIGRPTTPLSAVVARALG
ncbi:MAG TPA: SDR family oxidoreductase [Ramlibacter sp.]|jgi:NAD(P)H dehydrogenase (quinone)